MYAVNGGGLRAGRKLSLGAWQGWEEKVLVDQKACVLFSREEKRKETTPVWLPTLGLAGWARRHFLLERLVMLLVIRDRETALENSSFKPFFIFLCIHMTFPRLSGSRSFHLDCGKRLKLIVFLFLSSKQCRPPSSSAPRRTATLLTIARATNTGSAKRDAPNWRCAATVWLSTTPMRNSCAKTATTSTTWTAVTAMSSVSCGESATKTMDDCF